MRQDVLKFDSLEEALQENEGLTEAEFSLMSDGKWCSNEDVRKCEVCGVAIYDDEYDLIIHDYLEEHHCDKCAHISRKILQ